MPAPASAPASAPAPAPTLAAAPVASTAPHPVTEKLPEFQTTQASEDVARGTVENTYGDDYQEDTYEEEDEVDFDLGNGPSSGTATTTAALAVPTKYEESPGPSFHTTRGPSAKEDG